MFVNVLLILNLLLTLFYISRQDYIFHCYKEFVKLTNERIKYLAEKVNNG